jgi:hypothetical protein
VLGEIKPTQGDVLYLALEDHSRDIRFPMELFEFEGGPAGGSAFAALHELEPCRSVPLTRR